jgi:hypothetical protein
MLPAVMPKNRFGRPSARNGSAIVPVRLGDDADAKALRLEQAADQRHAEAGVVDVGIAGDQMMSQLSQPSCPSRRATSAKRV